MINTDSIPGTGDISKQDLSLQEGLKEWDFLPFLGTTMALGALNAILQVPGAMKAMLMWKMRLTLPPSSFPMNSCFCCQQQEQKPLYHTGRRNTAQHCRCAGLPSPIQDSTGSTTGGGGDPEGTDVRINVAHDSQPSCQKPS